MNVLLAAVMYSPNLGDGVIAECLTHSARRQSGPDFDLNWLDLAGRSGFEPPHRGGQLRTSALNTLSKLPDFLAVPASRCLVSLQIQRSLVPKLPSSFEHTDALVIGGGQLLADANMNFPLKLHRVVGEAIRRQVPFAIHSVGVAASWNRPASRLFQQIFEAANLKSVSVRDARSKANLLRHFERMRLRRAPVVSVMPDPGFLAAEICPKVRRPERSRPLIGLGVIHPVALRLHSSNTVPSDLLERYAALCGALERAGFDVALFSNGSLEDEQMRTTLRESNLAVFQGGTFVWLDRPQDARGLMALISSFDGVISHRLHANILAYACEIPHIGVRWDHKMDAYFELSDRENFLIGSDFSDPDRIAALMIEAMSSGISAERHAQLCHDARVGIRTTLSALGEG